MAYTPKSSLIKTTGHYTAQQLYAAFEPMIPNDQKANARRLIDRVVVLSKQLGLDEIIAAAVIWIETGAAGSGLPFRSEWWKKGLNAGNLGITGDPKQNAAAQTWSTPEDAANGLMAHLVGYALGKDWRTVWDVDELGEPRMWDWRFDLAINNTPNRAGVKTLGDLNRRWAIDADDNYGGKLAERANKLMSVMDDQGEEPMPDLVFGTVPHPFYQDRYISNSTAWNDLGKRGAKCVVWHRMYGTLWGTDGYFRGEASGRALTDYGVGVSATDGAGQAGVILRWNDPLGRRAGWASGPVNNPIGDGAKFVNLYGVNAVNRDGVSIEISGNGSTALDAKARAAVVALTAYWADQYGKVLAAKGRKFDYTTWPFVPDEDNRSFVCYHGEFYDGKRNSCPGPVVEAATDGMFAEIKALLQQYQAKVETPSTPEEPVYATPKKPAAGDSTVNGRIFLAHAQEYTTLAAVTPRIYSDPGSDPTGPDIAKGAKVKTSHVVSDVGESADLTAVLEDGSRIPIKGVLVAA